MTARTELLQKLAKEYTDYSAMVDWCCDSMILNNDIIAKYNEHYYDVEVFCGSDYDEESEEFTEVFQYFIITKGGADMLKEYTNELVYYLPEFDMYLLGVTHYGTNWQYVSANWKECDE